MGTDARRQAFATDDELLTREDAQTLLRRLWTLLDPYHAKIAGAVTLTALVVETVADQQLRRFLATREDAHAVLASGLWRLSRHPNYFGEVLFWWGLFLFGLASGPGWAWTAVGALSINLLFVLVSIPWMDRRMLSRHPEWAEQLRSTSPLVPWPRRHR